jgi:hypothetical protein
MVFVSAEPDIEFAAPREFDNVVGNGMLGFSGLTTAVVQSDIQYDDSDEAHMFASPASDVYKEVFGERVTSMREFLHRSSLSFVYQHEHTSGVAGIASNRIPLKRMPPPPGVYNNGWWQGTTSSGAGQRVFYSKLHPLLTMSQCFVGYKGSVNVTVNVDQPNGVTDVDTLALYRVQNGSVLSSTLRLPQASLLMSSPGTGSLRARTTLGLTDSGRAGMGLTNTKTNTGLVAQLPYYSKSAFTLCGLYNEYNNQDSITDGNNDWWQAEWRYNKAASNETFFGSQTSVYYSSGPDFDLVFFVNVPIMAVVGITAV